MGLFNRTPQQAGQWRREDGDIAVRIESQDVRRDFVNRPFIVYHGTVALVFSKGALLDRVAAGEYDIDGPARKWLVGDDPTVLVLTEAGDISLDVQAPGFQSADGIPLVATIRLTIRLDRPEAFYLNVMKDRKQFRNDDLLTIIRPEVAACAGAFAHGRAAADLVRSPIAGEQLAALLPSRLAPALARLGFMTVAAAVIGIESPALGALQSSQTEVSISRLGADVEAARQSVAKRVRADAAASETLAATTQAELDNSIRQAIHELGLKDVLRADEVARLEETLRHDLLDLTQDRAQRRAIGATEHDLEKDARRKEHLRAQTKADKEQELDLDKNEYEFAKRLRDDALAAKNRTELDEVGVEKERIAAYNTANPLTLVALYPSLGPEVAEQLRIQNIKGLTDVQALILAAERSPAVAAAMAEKFKAEGKHSDELLAEVRQVNRDVADRIQQFASQAIAQMGAVATARAAAQGPGSQTVVTGGLGQPTIINPPQAPGGSS